MFRQLEEIIKTEEISRKVNLYSVNDSANLTYMELLQMKAWKQLRQEILERDGYSCKKCGGSEIYKKWVNGEKKWRYFEVIIPTDCKRFLNYFYINGTADSFYIYDERDITFIETDQPRTLHVHHKYYIENRLPWQYEEDCFESLCVNCHFKLHEENKIPFYVFSNDGLIASKNMTPCLRCNGAGIFPEYKHVENGICFRCWGAKYEQLITEEVKLKSKRFYNKLKQIN